MKLHKAFLLLLPVLAVSCSFAQQTPPPGPVEQTTTPSGYILGPGDQISVFVADLDADIYTDKVFRVDTNGDVSLPVIGHLHALGSTTSELEAQAQTALVHELKNPKVSISLANFGSQSVSVLGAVNQPGLHQLEGHKNLFEVLSLAQGFAPEAGYKVTVTRDLKWGAIPLPQAVTDPTGKMSIASIKVKSILNSADLADNIQIFPGDTISVPPAQLVYAVGSVTKAGAFPLNGQETLSALQVVSLAEGPSKTAALNKAKILRAIPGSKSRAEIPVNLKLLLAGKGPDVPVQPDDILFIPNSGAKSATYRTLDAIASAAAFAAGHSY